MSLILYLAVFCMLWFLVEILSIVLKMTGLELSKARFQIISILTHTGYTTRESELIVQHPVRRRIASMLMIISYVAQASLIGLLFDLFLQDQRGLLNLLIVTVVLLLFTVVVSRNKYISGRFDRLAEKILSKRLRRAGGKRIDRILNLSPEFSIYEIVVGGESHLCNKTLREARLKDNYIQILKIDRGSEVLDFPLADTRIQQGDRMIVYGKIASIAKYIMK